MSKIALAFAVAATLLIPVAFSMTANAQHKCYHCYVDKYGKKICHDDCSCQGKH
jgi:hypothetical protein